ncbi:hypothetical protein Syun_029964 [Stephania yunnanensis]|uniref:Uncharacterized protein n=1 Tax=Stephania yunnanensis TaxID=152371 RepID=A0AAP0HLV1_9MAGN
MGALMSNHVLLYTLLAMLTCFVMTTNARSFGGTPLPMKEKLVARPADINGSIHTFSRVRTQLPDLPSPTANRQIRGGGKAWVRGPPP